MARKTKNKGFSLPMHLVVSTDNLRTSMTCVYFEGEYMYATDAHVAVRAKIGLFSDFSQDEIGKLNGKFIHWRKFKELFGKNILHVQDDGLYDPIGEVLYKFTKMGMKYPALDKLITERLNVSPKGFELIGLNARLLHDLQKAMSPGHQPAYSLHLNFAEKTNSKYPAGIIAKHPDFKFEELVGLIMPVSI